MPNESVPGDPLYVDQMGSVDASPSGGEASLPPVVHNPADRRPDADIEKDIRAELAEDLNFHEGGLQVSVTDGAVLLAGSCSNEAAARRALLIAEGVRGITFVRNEIQVAAVSST